MSVTIMLGLVAALATGEGAPRFGIATSSGNAVCLALPGAPVVQGTEVMLVAPEKPQQVYRARVQAPLATCERLKSATVEGPYYELAGMPAEARGALLAVAIVGVAHAGVSGGVVEVGTESASGRVSVRSCASREGLHLTAWAGKPLESRRVWHAYWYLGYDVEPSCTKKEMEE